MNCCYCSEKYDMFKYCTSCGYPLKMDASVNAPEQLIKFAKLWHNGHGTALFSVIILKEIRECDLAQLITEITNIRQDERAVCRGPSTQDEIQKHLDALNLLES